MSSALTEEEEEEWTRQCVCEERGGGGMWALEVDLNVGDALEENMNEQEGSFQN